MNKIIKTTIENQLQLEMRTEEHLQKQSPAYEKLIKKVSEIAQNFTRDIELAKKLTGYECLKKINDPLYIVYNSIAIFAQHGKKKEPKYTHACIILGREMLLKSLEYDINQKDKKMHLQSKYQTYEKVIEIMKENNINIKEEVNIEEEYFLKIGDIIGQILEKYEIIKFRQTSVAEPIAQEITKVKHTLMYAPRMYEINEEFANEPLARKLPMVIVPTPRINSDILKGGYLRTIVPFIKHNSQIQVNISNYDCTAINILQNTPFQINPAMLYYMKNKITIMEKKEGEAKKKADEIDKEIIQLQHKRNRARLELNKEYNKNISLKEIEKKKWEKKINEFEEIRYILKYVEVLPEGPFYFPMSMDARGRIYYVPEIINPQASIMSRALLDFASTDGALLINNDNYERCLYNLKLIGASYAGKATLSEKEKIEWIDKNEHKIMNFLTEDRFLDEIENAPLFIRFCLEYVSMKTTALEHFKRGEQYRSKMICYIDMSCNAVQHYTALTLKEELAHLVNMKDTDYPMDIYTFVGEEIIKKIKDSSFDKIKQKPDLIRKLVKKPIITHFYGVTDYTIREQIQDVCLKYNIQNYETIVRVLRRRLREYFNENLQKLSIEHYEWTTPTNLKIKQDYKVEERKIVGCTCFYNKENKNQKNFLYYKKTNKSDTKINKQTILANYIYSIYAAHLNVIIKKYNKHTAIVNDSIGVQLNQINRVKEIVKETFIEMHTEFHKNKK